MEFITITPPFYAGFTLLNTTAAEDGGVGNILIKSGDYVNIISKGNIDCMIYRFIL
jgi:hypothetical protein